MTKLRFGMLTIVLFAAFIMLQTTSAFAQQPGNAPGQGRNPDFQKDLQDAIEQAKKPNSHSPAEAPKTMLDLSRDHFMKCVSEDKPKYTTEIQEMMCACEAAKMVDAVEPKVIEKIYEDSRAGNNARATFIMHVSAPCITENMDEVILNTCKNDPYIKKNIIYGKKKICACVQSRFRDNFKITLPKKLMQISVMEPMTIDPLHVYLGQDEFKYDFGQYTQNCHANTK